MKQLLLLLSVVLISASSCKKDNNDNQPVKTKREILSSGKWLISKSDAVVGQQGNPQNVTCIMTLCCHAREITTTCLTVTEAAL